jgi:hypothetical protein
MGQFLSPQAFSRVAVQEIRSLLQGLQRSVSDMALLCAERLYI